MVDLAEDLKKARRISITLFIAFVVLTSSIALLVAFTPELKTATTYESHEPIHIDGDDEFSNLDDAVTGSGTSDDPFMIENLSIAISYGVGIQINDTSAFTIIRNCRFELTDNIYRFYTSKGFGTIGILLMNVSNVKVEYSSFHYLENGIAVRGNFAEHSTDIIISSCLFEACRNGTYLSNVDESVIERCNMRYIENCPVLLERCHDSEVAFSNLENFGYYIHIYLPKCGSGAVAASNCSDMSIHDNLIWGRDSTDYEAVEIYDSTLISVTGNTLAHSGWNEALVVRSSKVNLTDNHLAHDGRIYFNSSSECSINGNLFGSWISASHLSDSVISSNVMGGGIWLEHSCNCTLEENLLDVGVRSELPSIRISGDNISVLRNVVHGGADGVQVNGEDIIVKGNIISEIGTYSKGGLVASRCNRLIVTDNKIFNTTPVDTRYGSLCLEDSSNVTLARNNLTYGVSFWRARQIDMHDNNLNMPARLFLYDYELTPVAHGSRIVHNNFIYSQVTMSGDPVVLWNDSYPAGGNYWSPYGGDDLMSGEDQDQPGPDGIGDEPYAIDYRNNDSYPLMEQIAFIDESAPITFARISGTTGDRCWYRSNLSVTLPSFDNYAGITDTLFRLDGGTWQTYESAVKVSGDGVHVLEYYSVDSVGNEENPHLLTMRIDTQAPVPDDDVGGDYRFDETVSALIPAGFSDQVSGISCITAGYLNNTHLDEPFCTPELLVELREGPNTIRINARDMAGNERSVVVQLDASINHNRNPLSTDGPYGPLLLLALIADFVILALVLVYASRAWSTEFRYKPRESREPGERDKVYDVEDGYTKHMKKM